MDSVFFCEKCGWAGQNPKKYNMGRDKRCSLCGERVEEMNLADLCRQYMAQRKQLLGAMIVVRRFVDFRNAFPSAQPHMLRWAELLIAETHSNDAP